MVERYRLKDPEKLKRNLHSRMPLGTKTLLEHLEWYEVSADRARRTKAHILEFLGKRPELKVEFDAWQKAGGGTTDDFRQWLRESARREPNRLRLVWSNPRQQIERPSSGRVA